MFTRSLICLILGTSALAQASSAIQDDEDEPSPYTVAFGGQYRIVADAANFDFHPRVILDDSPAQSFVNQRFRTWVNFHDRDGRTHGAYFQVEIGHIA